MNKLLNYTSNVPIEKTIQEIQAQLLKARASAIAFEYDSEGTVQSIFFKIKRKDGVEMPFKLPAKVKEVYQTLYAGKIGENRYGAQRMAQASRTAWRIILTWLKAQVALLELEMVKPEEVFLPYMMINAKQTLFENMEQRNFMLPAPKDDL